MDLSGEAVDPQLRVKISDTYTYGRGEEVLGSLTGTEILRIYDSTAKCEGIWIECEGRRPLLEMFKKWHGIQRWEDAVVPPSAFRKIPLLTAEDLLKRNPNEE